MAVWSFSILGDAIRDRMDPKLRGVLGAGKEDLLA
jgi:hypothetical protein